jgi:hypothetical protein
MRAKYRLADKPSNNSLVQMALSHRTLLLNVIAIADTIGLLMSGGVFGLTLFVFRPIASG